MIIYVINNNILISHPYYSVVYQDEAKYGIPKKIYMFFGVGTKGKIWQKCGSCYSWNNWHTRKNQPAIFLKDGWV